MLALIVPPCVLTAAAAPAPPAAPPPPAAPSAVMSADASSGEVTMTSDSSAYTLGKPGATTCPTGYMLVVSAEACKQITSIKSGTLSSPDVTVTNAKDKDTPTGDTEHAGEQESRDSGTPAPPYGAPFTKPHQPANQAGAAHQPRHILDHHNATRSL